MKTCGKCKVDKNVSEFSTNVAKRDGLQSSCKLCVKEYNKGWYTNNSAIQIDRVNKSKVKIKQYIYDVLAQSKCADCPESRIPALQFDHTYPSSKSFNIGEATRTGKSLELVKIEIAKCVVRCANCHAVKTAEQFKWYNQLVVDAGGRSESQGVS